MSYQFKLSKNVIEELTELVKNGAPALSSERGDVFLSKRLPVGAIRLKVPLNIYLSFIQSLDTAVQPKTFDLIPQTGMSFDVFINQSIMVKDSGAFIAGVPVVVI